MRITVFAKPNSKRPGVEKIDSTHYQVSVSAPAQEGRANMAILAELIKYFNAKPWQIDIVSGLGSKTKIFEVDDALGF